MKDISPGIGDGVYTSRQLDLLNLRALPETDEEVVWYEKHCLDILPRETLPPPVVQAHPFGKGSFVANVSAALDDKADGE